MSTTELIYHRPIRRRKVKEFTMTSTEKRKFSYRLTDQSPWRCIFLTCCIAYGSTFKSGITWNSRMCSCQHFIFLQIASTVGEYRTLSRCREILKQSLISSVVLLPCVISCIEVVRVVSVTSLFLRGASLISVNTLPRSGLTTKISRSSSTVAPTLLRFAVCNSTICSLLCVGEIIRNVAILNFMEIERYRSCLRSVMRRNYIFLSYSHVWLWNRASRAMRKNYNLKCRRSH